MVVLGNIANLFGSWSKESSELFEDPPIYQGP